MAHDISAYSLVALAPAAAPMMTGATAWILLLLCGKDFPIPYLVLPNATWEASGRHHAKEYPAIRSLRNR